MASMRGKLVSACTAVQGQSFCTSGDCCMGWGRRPGSMHLVLLPGVSFMPSSTQSGWSVTGDALQLPAALTGIPSLSCNCILVTPASWSGCFIHLRTREIKREPICWLNRYVSTVGLKPGAGTQSSYHCCPSGLHQQEAGAGARARHPTQVLWCGTQAS